MRAGEVAGAVASVSLAALQAPDGVVERGLVVCAELLTGEPVLLRWRMDSQDCRAASEFFAAYAAQLDQAADAELRKICGGDGS